MTVSGTFVQVCACPEDDDTVIRTCVSYNIQSTVYCSSRAHAVPSDIDTTSPEACFNVGRVTVRFLTVNPFRELEKYVTFNCTS